MNTEANPQQEGSPEVSKTRVRQRLGLMACGAALGAALLSTPEAHAGFYPDCGMGIPSVSTPWGGFCDSPPMGVGGQHYHCQWGMGFQLCEYRWADNTPAPAPTAGKIGGLFRA